jgi:cytochrome c553
MKPLITFLALLALTFPSHAASPRAFRRQTAACAGRVRVVEASHTVNHSAAKQQFVITAFAVPVAVPVAPFAPYWYGVSDYQEPFSLRGSASQRAAREAEPRGTGFRGRASEPERSITVQKCTACHGRTSPKQGLSLVDPFSLSDSDRLRAIRAVVNGEMPPAESDALTDADRTAILRELTAD